MPIYHYPGFITKETAARTFQVQVRTINDWIRKTSPAPNLFSYIIIDGYICIKAVYDPAVPPPGILPDTLEGVRHFAKRNKISFADLYEEIIKGKISGVILAERIFVIKTEPQLIEYVAKHKR